MLDPRERLLRPPIEVFVLVAVRLYRDGIADAVARDSRFKVVGSAATFDDAHAQLRALERPPDAALVDLGLAEGAGAARALRDSWPETCVVALGVREVDHDVVSLAEAGASGLVSRDATLSELLDAVEAAARNEALCSPAVTAVLLRRVASVADGQAPADGPRLTRREREVVRLMGKGLSNKEIAGSLRIELATVKNHVHNILEKLRVHRRTDAVAAARARGELNRIRSLARADPGLRLDRSRIPRSIHVRPARAQTAGTRPRRAIPLECIRIVLIDMPPLLRDIVRDAVAREPDLDVVAEREVAGLRESVERDEPDFVIVGTDRASETVRSVVAERRGVRALEVRSDGKESVLYELRPHRVSLGEISPDTLVQTIRAVPAWDAEHVTDETS